MKRFVVLASSLLLSLGLAVTVHASTSPTAGDPIHTCTGNGSSTWCKENVLDVTTSYNGSDSVYTDSTTHLNGDNPGDWCCLGSCAAEFDVSMGQYDHLVARVYKNYKYCGNYVKIGSDYITTASGSGPLPCGCPSDVSCVYSWSHNGGLTGELCSGHRIDVNFRSGTFGKCGYHAMIHCSICGLTHECTYDHNWEWIYDSYATCVEDGVKHVRCRACGATRSWDTVWENALGHSYDKYWTVEEATCLAKEQIIGECTRTIGAHDGKGTNMTNYGWSCTHNVSGHYTDRSDYGSILKHTYESGSWTSAYPWWDNGGSGPSPNSTAHKTVTWSRKSWEHKRSATWSGYFSPLGSWDCEYAWDCSRTGTDCGTDSCDDHYHAYSTTHAYVFMDYANNVDGGPYWGGGDSSSGIKVWATGCTDASTCDVGHVSYGYYSTPDQPPDLPGGPYSTGTLGYNTTHTPADKGYPDGIAVSIAAAFREYHAGLIIRPKYVKIIYHGNGADVGSTADREEHYDWGDPLELWNGPAGNKWQEDIWAKALGKFDTSKVASTPYSRHGYIQIGWSLDGGNTLKYSIGQSWSRVEQMSEASTAFASQTGVNLPEGGQGETSTTGDHEVHLYAVWKPIEYDVQYYPDPDTHGTFKHFDVSLVYPKVSGESLTTHHIYDVANNLVVNPYYYTSRKNPGTRDDGYYWTNWQGQTAHCDSTLTHFDSAQSVTSLSHVIWDKLPFKSHWVAQPYKVAWHSEVDAIPNWDAYELDVSEDGHLGSTTPSGTTPLVEDYTFDDDVSYKQRFTRVGYTAYGWVAQQKEQPSNNGDKYYGRVSSAGIDTRPFNTAMIAYNFGDTDYGLTPVPNATVHYRICWEPIQYKVAWEGEPCEGCPTPTFLYKEKTGIHAPFDKAGNTLDDWHIGEKTGLTAQSRFFDKNYTLETALDVEIWARGYRFAEWHYDTIPYERAFPDKYASTMHGTMPAGEIYHNLWSTSGTTTFRAVWEPIEYTLVYDSNDGIAWSQDGTKITPSTDTMARIHQGEIIVENKQHKDPLHTYDDVFPAWGYDSMTKDGYTLVGWTWNKDSREPDVNFGDSLDRLTYWGDDKTSPDAPIPGEDNIVTLYAIWVDNRYIVNYDEGYNVDGSWVPANMTWSGRSGSLYDYLLFPTGHTADSSHIFDVPANLTPNDYKATGYTWTGWMFNGADANRTAGLSENDLYWTHEPAGNEFGDAISIKSFRNVNDKGATPDPDPDATLHSVWKVHEYDLVLWYHGAEDDKPIGSTPVVNKGPADGAATRLMYYEWFTLPSPTRDGWDFIGWWRERIQPHTQSYTDTNTWWSLDTGFGFSEPDYRTEFNSRTKYGPSEEIRALTPDDGAVVNLHAVWVRHVYKVHYLPGVGDYYWTADSDPTCINPDPLRPLTWMNNEGGLSYTDRHRYNNDKGDVDPDAAFWEDLFQAEHGGQNSPSKFMSDDTPRYFDQDIMGYPKYTVRANEYSAEGYTWKYFDSVTTYKDSTIKHWKNPMTYNNLVDIPRRYTDSGEQFGDIDMISVWEVNKYNIHFDPNEEMGTTPVSGIPSDVTNIKWYEWTTLPDTLTRDGYDFIGWTTNPSVKEPHDTVETDKNHYWRKFNPTPVPGNGTPDGTRDYRDDFRTRVDFGPNEDVRALTPENGKTVTLYAVWKPHTYKIVYWNTVDGTDTGEPLLKKDIDPSVPGSGNSMVTYEGIIKSGNVMVPGDVGTGKNLAFLPNEDYTSRMFYPYTGGTCETTDHIFDVWDYLRENTNDVYKKSVTNNVTNNGFVWLGWEGVKNYKDTSLKRFENKEYMRNLTDKDNDTVCLTAAWRPALYNLYINPYYDKALQDLPDQLPHHTLSDKITGGGYPLYTRPTEAQYPVPGGYFTPLLNLPFNEDVTLPTDDDRFHMQGYNLVSWDDHHAESTDTKHTYSTWLALTDKNTPTVETKLGKTLADDFWTFRYADSACPGTVGGHEPGSVVQGLTYQDKDTILLEAQWEPITYTITYHPNVDPPTEDPDDDPGKWVDPEPYEYDVKYPPREPGPTGSTDEPPFEDLKPGYHIDYWSEDPDGGGRKFTVHDFEEPDNVDIEEYITNMTTIDKANIHLYAHWAPNTYFVVLHDNFKGSDQTYTKVMTYDQSWVLPTEEDLKKLPANTNDPSFNAFREHNYGSRYGKDLLPEYIVNQPAMRIDHSDIRHLFLGYQHIDSAPLCREKYAIPSHSAITRTPSFSHVPGYARPYQWRAGNESDALLNLTTERFVYVHVNIIWDIAPTISYSGKDADGNLSSLEEHLLQEDIATWAVNVDDAGNTTISRSQLEQWLLSRCTTNDFEWDLRRDDEIPQGEYSIPTWEDGAYQLKVVSFDPVRIRDEAQNPNQPSNTYYITFTVIDDVGQSDTCQITLYIGQDVNIRVD